MSTQQVEISTPQYKDELKAQLKQRLGRQVTNHVAAKSGFSDRYVRAWFSSPLKNDSIKRAAFQLLEELKAEEVDEYQTLKQ